MRNLLAELWLPIGGVSITEIEEKKNSIMILQQGRSKKGMG